jgi:tetratricopeptide (TPR) repeat protein
MLNKPDKNAKLKIAGLLSLISRNRNNRDACLMLAAELARINRYDHAIKYFQKANDIREDYISLYNIGSLYYKKGEYKKAILALEKSKQRKPDYIMSSLVTGLSYSRLNNLKAAVSNFINVLMIDPSNKTALAALSIIYHNSGRLSDSYRLMKRLSDKYPADEKIINIKSDILYFSGNAAESIQEIKDLKKKSEKFRRYDEYIKSVPVEICNDRYGTLNDKVAKLESEDIKSSDNLLKLSLVHLFSGNTDSAIDYLFEARRHTETFTSSSL